MTRGTGWFCRPNALARKRFAAAASCLALEEKVEGRAGRIHRAIQVAPLALDPDVGLVHPPTVRQMPRNARAILCGFLMIDVFRLAGVSGAPGKSRPQGFVNVCREPNGRPLGEKGSDSLASSLSKRCSAQEVATSGRLWTYPAPAAWLESLPRHCPRPRQRHRPRML